MVKSSMERGQALVLVLLSLAVVLTIVLFVLSRSITDVAVSSNESQSVSAFSAAEAGVEQALITAAASNTTQTGTVGDAQFNAQITDVAKGSTSFIYPAELSSGDTMILWLKAQDGGADYNSNSVEVCWGRSGTGLNTNQTPAIESILFYDTGANAKVFRAAFDPYGTRRTNDNSFAAPDAGTCTIDSTVFQFHKVINFGALPTKQFVVIRMFYNTTSSHPVGFKSSGAAVLFPSQGKQIDSSGTAGQSSRKVQVFQSWPEIPNVLLYGLYSPGGITK